MPCPSCGRGFHDECYEENCETCHPIEDIKESLVTIGAPIKSPEQIRDVASTGRKRAALLYPIFKDKPCEWQGQKNCGGGLHPIIGCIKGRQKHRHHGPVKNTLRNEAGNVHRICSTCHSRWHAKNDEVYDEKIYSTLPHQPEQATDEELAINDAHYKLNNRKYWKDRDDN